MLSRAFSFVDLVSLKVVSDLRRRKVSEADIRQGVMYLEELTGHAKPFAHRDVVELLATSGTALLVDIQGGWYDIGKGGQGASKEVVRLWLKRVSYDNAGVAELWRPAKLILINPAVQAGAPCVEGTRVPTGTIADMAAEDPVDVVADDLDLTFEQVSAAVAFERSLREGRGLAA
jgi:uncharacterized protein (DUF433 family)